MGRGPSALKCVSDTVTVEDVPAEADATSLLLPSANPSSLELWDVDAIYGDLAEIGIFWKLDSSVWNLEPAFFANGAITFNIIIADYRLIVAI